jgi:nucleoid-associated protein YgaU
MKCLWLLVALVLFIPLLPPDFFFYEVQSGDTLWGIADQFMGGGWNYPQIVEANSRQILDPHWIYPGQVFIIPVQQ